MEQLTVSAADIQIIRHLEKDPRSPVARIAEALDMPESTVRNRLNRLTEAGIIDFAAMVNPLQFGYQVWTVMLIECEVAKISSVAEKLAKLPEIYFVGISVGNFNIFASAIFRTNQELLAFVKKELARIPGITHTSINSLLEITKRTIPSGLANHDKDNATPKTVKVAKKRGNRKPEEPIAEE